MRHQEEREREKEQAEVAVFLTLHSENLVVDRKTQQLGHGGGKRGDGGEVGELESQRYTRRSKY